MPAAVALARHQPRAFVPLVLHRRMLSRRGIAVSFATARAWVRLPSTTSRLLAPRSSLPRFLASSVHLVNTPGLAPAFSS
eukprot:450350-Prymnesium_polylepis.1